jgi:hypothetical protein
MNIQANLECKNNQSIEMSSLEAAKIVPSKASKSVRGKPKKLSEELVYSRIALSAYYKAEARGYEPRLVGSRG